MRIHGNDDVFGEIIQKVDHAANLSITLLSRFWADLSLIYIKVKTKMSEKETLVSKAKLAEQAERYDDMSEVSYY